MAKRQSRKDKRRDETSVATGGFIDPYMSPQEKQRMKLLARRQGRHPEGRRHSKRHASRLEGFMNFMKQGPGEGAGAYSGTRDTPTTSMSSIRRLQGQSEKRGAEPWKYWRDNQPSSQADTPQVSTSSKTSNNYWNPPDEGPVGLKMPSGAVWSTDDWKRDDKNLVTRGLEEGAEATNRGIKNFDLGNALKWMSGYPATQKLMKEFKRAEEILNEENI